MSLEASAVSFLVPNIITRFCQQADNRTRGRTEAVRRGIRDGGADGDGDGKASPKKMLKILNRSLKYMKRANKELVKVLKDAGRKSRQPLLDPSPNESKQGSVDIESERESACGTASDL